MSASKNDVKNKAQSAPKSDAPEPATTYTTKPASVQFVNKVSTKTVVGKFNKPEKPRALYSVIGIVHGLKRGNTDKGEFVSFIGSFEATNSQTGERFAGGKCFLPNVVNEMLVSSLQQAQENDASATLRFALEVGVKPSTNAFGYEYTVRPLIDLRASDALADLRAQVESPALGYDAPIRS